MNDTAKGVLLIPHEPSRALTPFELLERAITSGASTETLEKLMALQERHEANEARKMFDAAMAAIRAEIVPIKKNRRVKFEAKDPGKAKTNYQYEDLAAVAAMLDPIIAKHGISYRFNTSSDVDQPVIVTMIIFGHGHSERNTLSAGRDNTGNKNAIQAIGSTVTFLQRYLLKAGFGLAAANDDDGQSSGEPETKFITDDQVTALTDLATEVGADMGKLLAFLKVASLAEIYSDKYDAVEAVIRKKATKK